MKTAVEGSFAVAKSVALCRPGVIAAYPITPQTHIVEFLADMVANGESDARYINVESEHSAISACIGASASGVRTFTATSSQGLALMHEILYVASGMRLPIVMVNANRALSAPLNIWNDCQDSISERDSSWIQIYVETNQEALDSVIQAYKVAENHDILLPFMINLDGFILTHAVEPVDIPEQNEVDSFLPPFKPYRMLDPENPMTFGPIAFPNSYTDFKKMQWDAMEKSLDLIKKVNEEFSNKFGRSYGNGVIECYNMNNAKYAIVSLGSVCGTIKEVIDRHPDVGLVRIRTYRPFPFKEVENALKDIDYVAVLEKDISIGLGGVLYNELGAILNNSQSYIIGLGGKDIRASDIEKIINKLKSAKPGDKKMYWQTEL